MDGLSDDHRRELREAYGCGCGPERADLRKLRVVRGSGGDDALGILASCEEATGSEPAGCPWAAMRDPFVLEVIQAHRWSESGQLDVHYPSGIPNVVKLGVEWWAGAVSSVQTHDIREDRRRRAREEAERELQESAKR